MLDLSIIIKGAGEIASAIAHRLFMANMSRICMIDVEAPLCVRRTVSFCEAIFQKSVLVDGVIGTLVHDPFGIYRAWERREIAVIVDPKWKIIDELKPDIVVDAIMAKRNLGTHKGEASAVIGVGPGFSAPDVVHAVIESNRGPNLGRAIYAGAAEAFTGIPSMRAGYSWERVLRAPHRGQVRHLKSIGDRVHAGETVLFVNSTPVAAAIDGILRGLIREIEVGGREKVGDIEPGTEAIDCRTMSDKAMAVGGGVLEAVMHLFNINEFHEHAGRRLGFEIGETRAS